MSVTRPQQEGFSLIELLIVIAIIGLLATVAVIAFRNTRARSRDARRINDLRLIAKAVELYKDENGEYPQPSRGWSQWSGHCPTYGDDDEYILGLVPDYMPALPQDPKYDVAAQCYLYRSDRTDYTVIAHQVMESICGGDPGDSCNPPYIQALDRPNFNQPTIAIYSPGAATW